MGQFVYDPQTGKSVWQETPTGQGFKPGGSFTSPLYTGMNRNPNADLGGVNPAVNRFRQNLNPSGQQVFGALSSQGRADQVRNELTPGKTFAELSRGMQFQSVANLGAGATGDKKDGEDLETSDVGSNILSGTESTDWTQLFTQFRAAGIEAAEATRLAQQTAAQNTYAAQLRSAQTAARQNQMAVQQARQQISEQDFMQQRQLVQGAQSRGLGGSGIEQLARTQQRMGTGQNINQLAQQEMLGNEKLMNYVSEVETKKGEKLADADAQYYNNLFKLAGNDLENMKFLDSNQYRDKVFDWQQKNAAEITANNNLNTRLDLIKLMESKDLSDTGKKAVAAMMLEAGKIGDQEVNDLLDQYLGSAAGDKLVKGKYDWTSALVTGGLAAVGLTIATLATGGLSIPAILIGSAIAGTVAGGVSQEIQNLQGKIAFNIPGIGEWKGTRAEAIDKNNPNSLVSKAFGDKQAFKDLQFTLEGTEVRFIYQGNTYDKFNDVQAVWLRAQGR
jgi:hypothetical protein